MGCGRSTVSMFLESWKKAFDALTDHTAKMAAMFSGRASFVARQSLTSNCALVLITKVSKSALEAIRYFWSNSSKRAK